MNNGAPYYAVIFTSVRTAEDDAGYGLAAERIAELAAQMPGFLGIESARGEGGLGITVSYWESLDVIKAWREQAEHRLAQQMGKERWYQQFTLRICKVEAVRSFERTCTELA